ncbi:AMP-binding protein, partial [Mycobacterium sp. 852002-51971_SCH5477799-a]|uniref:AMP-binding protein n=1 Tax=Mycobacterium sp. 852002-51971_SCH5477799-a TaxID=1834106 RepID=UPI0012E7F993
TNNRTLEHQHLALSEIHRITGHEQLFDTLFVYENYPMDAAAMAGDRELVVTEFTSHESTHYPLSIVALPGSELRLRVEFDTAVFDETRISTLIDRLRQVLAAMAADPARPLSSIDLLDEREHARLQEFGNRVVLTQPAPAEASIPELFGAQVLRAPEAVALVSGDRSWSYRELDEAANRVAHLLAGGGVGPGASVALLLPRSAEAIVAILGVLKTGAAYLPIDPAVPAARLQFMLGDAGPLAAVTTAALRPRLAGFGGLTVIDIDDPAVAAQPSTGLAPPAADDVAHIIYTSGTTGTPKGVAVTQLNVTQLFAGLDIGVELGPDQVWTQFHSYAFDFSVWEIWGALLHG